MNKEINKLVKFLEYSEGLKRELRHSWLSNGRQESTADHSWRMALLAILIGPKTKLNLDMEKVLKLVIVHDLVEIEANDIPAFLHMQDEELTKRKKTEEAKAIKVIKKKLDPENGQDIESLWLEYRDRKTKESIFANYLDKVEARNQKYLQHADKWTEGEKDMKMIRKYSKLIEELANGDEYLLKFANEIKEERAKKLGIRE